MPTRFFSEPHLKNLVMVDGAHMTRGGSIAFAKSIASDRDIRRMIRELG